MWQSRNRILDATNVSGFYRPFIGRSQDVCSLGPFPPVHTFFNSLSFSGDIWRAVDVESAVIDIPEWLGCGWMSVPRLRSKVMQNRPNERRLANLAHDSGLASCSAKLGPGIIFKINFRWKKTWSNCYDFLSRVLTNNQQITFKAIFL